MKRARMRALMHFIDEMPAAAVRVPTVNLAFLPRFQAMTRDEFVAMAESKPLRREFMLTMGQTGFPKAEMDAALGRLRRSYERMDVEVEKSGGPWLLGKEITLADVTAWGDPPEPQAATSHGPATTIPARHHPRHHREDLFIGSSSHHRSTSMTAV